MRSIGREPRAGSHHTSWLSAALEPFVPEPRRIAVLAAAFAGFAAVLSHEPQETRPLAHLVAWASPLLLVAMVTTLVASAVAGAVHRRVPTTLGWALPFYAIHAAASCVAVPIVTVYRIRLEAEAHAIDPWLFLVMTAGFVGFALLVNVGGVLHARCAVQADQLQARDALVDAAHEMLVVGEDGIRRDVAEVLHGRVQSRLLALELKLGRLAATLPDLQGASIEEITEHLRSLREDDVRNLSHSLHPSVIRLGLVPALNDLADHAEAGLGVHIVLDVDPEIADLDAPGSQTLSESARLTLYRAVEEGITNAHRHGNAGNVTIQLLRASSQVVLLVSDDGRGAAPDTPPGFGLTNIALRAEAQGGSMRVHHNPGAGMTLQVRLPVAVEARPGLSTVPAVAARRSTTRRGQPVPTGLATRRRHLRPGHRRLSLS